jgi:hypothetical protein
MASCSVTCNAGDVVGCVGERVGGDGVVGIAVVKGVVGAGVVGEGVVGTTGAVPPVAPVIPAVEVVVVADIGEVGIGVVVAVIVPVVKAPEGRPPVIPAVGLCNDVPVDAAEVLLVLQKSAFTTNDVMSDHSGSD